MTHLQKIKAKW